jgi:hypothetical protein
VQKGFVMEVKEIIKASLLSLLKGIKIIFGSIIGLMKQALLIKWFV